MAAMKELVFDIMESLERTNFDYEYVAEKFGMTLESIYEIAKDYGDVE